MARLGSIRSTIAARHAPLWPFRRRGNLKMLQLRGNFIGPLGSAESRRGTRSGMGERHCDREPKTWREAILKSRQSPLRHCSLRLCERSEAILKSRQALSPRHARNDPASAPPPLDCFVTSFLAMTNPPSESFMTWWSVRTLRLGPIRPRTRSIRSGASTMAKAARRRPLGEAKRVAVCAQLPRDADAISGWAPREPSTTTRAPMGVFS